MKKYLHGPQLILGLIALFANDKILSVTIRRSAVLLNVIVSILGAFLVTPFYSPHGKVSVRRKVGTDIKCDMIARKLNGRCHSYAAAGYKKP